MQPSNLNHKNAPTGRRRQEFSQACMNPVTCVSSADKVGLPGFALPHVWNLMTEQENASQTLSQCPPSHVQAVLPSLRTYFQHKQALSSVLGGINMSSSYMGSLQEGFLFDHLGNQVRLICNTTVPHVHNSPIPPVKHLGLGLHDKEEAATNTGYDNYLLHRESEGNHVTGEESEMHEDTEEINALLYSDDEYDCGSDDEVNSTGRFPVLIKGGYERQELKDITLIEEVASSDRPKKRHRSLDGACVEPHLMEDTGSSADVGVSNVYSIDRESSCPSDRKDCNEMNCHLHGKFSGKDKIQETLRALESIVPGATGKDPLLVIDEAIDYLRSLKRKARTLGGSSY